jgi:pilus assembly protein CpaE
LAGAIDRLLRRSGGEVKRGVAVAVYGAKGGLGNTTVAVNLAYAFAKTRPDGRIAIADLVIGSGDVRVMLDLKPTYDLGDLAMKVDRIDADLLYSLLTQCTDAVWALPAAESPEVADLLDASASTAIVTQLRAHFAYTVLDCEHHLSDRTVAALDGADKIVLVTQLSVPALRSTQRTLQLCERLGYPSEKMCVVVNRFSNSDVLSPADAAQVLQHEIYWKLPNDYKNSAAALNKGVPVVAYDPATPLAVSYAQLAAKLGGVTSEGAVNANGRGESSRLGRLFGKVRK